MRTNLSIALAGNFGLFLCISALAQPTGRPSERGQGIRIQDDSSRVTAAAIEKSVLHGDSKAVGDLIASRDQTTVCLGLWKRVMDGDPLSLDNHPLVFIGRLEGMLDVVTPTEWKVELLRSYGEGSKERKIVVGPITGSTHQTRSNSPWRD